MVPALWRYYAKGKRWVSLSFLLEVKVIWQVINLNLKTVLQIIIKGSMADDSSRKLNRRVKKQDDTAVVKNTLDKHKEDETISAKEKGWDEYRGIWWNVCSRYCKGL